MREREREIEREREGKRKKTRCVFVEIPAEAKMNFYKNLSTLRSRDVTSRVAD